MKKIVFIVLVAMVFCLAGCQNGTTSGGSPFEGTWGIEKDPTLTNVKYAFSGDEFDLVWMGQRFIGTFTYDDRVIYYASTWIWDNSNASEGREYIDSMSQEYEFKDGDLYILNINDAGESLKLVKVK